MPMAQLKSCLEELGCTNVQTYIASGNVLCTSAKKRDGAGRGDRG